MSSVDDFGGSTKGVGICNLRVSESGNTQDFETGSQGGVLVWSPWTREVEDPLSAFGSRETI